MPRIVDLLLLALIAPLAVPLAVVIALAVLLSVGRPVLFAQSRGGYRGSIFSIYKFRTMTNDRDGSGALLPDHVRLTRIGRFLRATSLDELPSLWNLLRGDMRIVGPRPFITDYLPLYSAEQYRRHDVRPGITGWAQVNGRNALTWEEKFAFDTWYVDHRSFWLDVKILVLTVRNVLRRDGIDASAEVTMPRFAGTKE